MKLWLTTFLYFAISKTRPNHIIDGVLDFMIHDCKKKPPPLGLNGCNENCRDY